jgi:hypothetical protein
VRFCGRVLGLQRHGCSRTTFTRLCRYDLQTRVGLKYAGLLRLTGTGGNAGRARIS